MMKKCMVLLCVGVFLWPCLADAQSTSEQLKGMHGVLEQLRGTMMAKCADLIGVSKLIAAFATIFYIGYRVWRQLANAEPIDFYPLFRPFVLGFCIINFSLVLALIEGIFKPVVMVTDSMVTKSNANIEVLLAKKEEAIKKTDLYQMYVGQNQEGDREKWLRYTKGIQPEESTPDEGWAEKIGNNMSFSLAKAGYKFRNSVKEWVSEILNMLYLAASLCIDVLRTFQLIILAILGPIVFAIATFDGFQQSLGGWLAKYMNIFLWLPVCNIFGAVIGTIQEEMLKIDLGQINQQGDTFFSPQDTCYIIFLIIGVIGYTTVPAVASFVINSGGQNPFTQKVTSIMSSMSSSVGGMAAGVALGAGAGLASRVMDAGRNIASAPLHLSEGLSGQQSGQGTSGAIGRGLGHKVAGSMAKKEDK